MTAISASSLAASSGRLPLDVHSGAVAALLHHFLEKLEDVLVAQRLLAEPACLDVLVLEGGLNQADRGEAVLFAGLHRHFQVGHELVTQHGGPLFGEDWGAGRQKMPEKCSGIPLTAGQVVAI
jgi:hypothetical protein